jgi:RNA ligase (TIGR02306 family)
MSEFHVEVVRIGKIEPLPNADALEITQVYGGYPCIIRKGEFIEGNLAVYLPVDSVLPDRPEWAFLGKRRIKAKRLRGTFSMGLLTRVPLVSVQPDGSGIPEGGWKEGDDATLALGVTKWEPAADIGTAIDSERDPQITPVYDIEGYRKYKHNLVEGEEVDITEKVHGQNFRAVYDATSTDPRLWVGSHKTFKKDVPGSNWWAMARKYNLEEKLKSYPNLALYGEVYGWVQDLHYSVPRSEGTRVMFFDVLDCKTRRWFNVDEFRRLMRELELPYVPVLYRGPWKPELVSLAEGLTTIEGPDKHVREGIVIKPVIERVDLRLGRVFLKLPGEGYLTRKEKD